MTHYEETMNMVEDFKKAKFSEEQTKVILKAVEGARKDGLENLATKQDLVNSESKLELKIAEVKGDINLLKWMTGVSIALCIAILARLLTQ